MNNADLERVNRIVSELITEFEKEAGKLKADYDNSSMRIREIDENIYNYKENEDIDIQVFTPRKIDNKTEVRLDSLNKEKDEMQSSVKGISRQMKYYNDKINKLKEIHALLNENQPGDENAPKYGIEEVFNIDEKIKDNPDKKTIDPFVGFVSEEVKPDIDEEAVDKDFRRVIPKINKANASQSDISSLIESLSRISHKADIGYKIVDNDVYRAKMEFKSIKSGLEDVLNSLK